MFLRTAATALAVTCALAVPADALSLGGLLGGRNKSTNSSSAPSGGASVGARAGGIGSSADAPVQTGVVGSRLPQKPGTPTPVVRACQLAAARAAQAYGAVSVEAASGGKFAPTAGGGGIAPVNLRVTYPGSAGSREAQVSCTIDRDGIVTGLNTEWQSSP